MEKSGADIESRPWLRILGNLHVVNVWETRETGVFCKNVLVENGGMRWGGGQGCGPSYQGRDSYMHLQRIYPIVVITVCSLKISGKFIHVLVTYPCSSMLTQCSLTL